MASPPLKTKTMLVMNMIIILIIFTHPIPCQLITCAPSSTECHCPNISSPTQETCIFNCITEDSCKSTTLYCRPNDPCEIRCESKAACSVSLNIEAYSSTHVNLICNGEDTCKSSNTLKCGTGDCRISCDGEASCQSFGLINTTNARSFECNGQCDFPNIPNQFDLSTTSPPTTIPSITPTLSPITNDESIYNKHSNNIEAIITTLIPTISPIGMARMPTLTTVESNEEVSGFNLFVINNIHPLYYVIAALLMLIFIVCFILFCWVYLSHNHTQKLIAEQKEKGRLDFDSKSVNFNPSRLNIPTSINGFQTSKSPSFDIENRTLTPSNTTRNTCTFRTSVPKMYPVNSGNSTATIELQQCVDSHSDQIAVAQNQTDMNETTDTDAETSISNSHSPLDEGYGADDKDGENITVCTYYKKYSKRHKIIHKTQNLIPLTRNSIQMTHIISPLYNNNNNNNNNHKSFSVPPPPPPLPVSHNNNNNDNEMENPLPHLPPPVHIHFNVPPPPPLVVRKSNIPPPPKTNIHLNNNNYNFYGYIHNGANNNDNISYNGKSQALVIHCEADKLSENNSEDLSDDTIMKHLNTIDSDFDGEEDANSMKAVRHPTLSNGTDPYDSPQIRVQIMSIDGMSNISLKKDNIEETMENIKKEIIEITQKFQFNQPPQVKISKNKLMNNENNDKKIQLEASSDNSKSFESYSLGNTPRPKEYSKEDLVDEESIADEEPDRNSYAIQLLGIEEPTFTDFNHSKTTSTVVEDTYLKYLNM